MPGFNLPMPSPIKKDFTGKNIIAFFIKLQHIVLIVILEHEKDHSLIVFADDEGLPLPMIKDPNGQWKEDIKTIDDIFENHYGVEDSSRQTEILDDTQI